MVVFVPKREISQKQIFNGDTFIKKSYIYFATVSFIFCLTLSTCSKGKDAESEKGAIDKITERAAETATKKIKTPIDKARSVQEKEEERMKAMDEASKR
jgi:hypothetical protein